MTERKGDEVHVVAFLCDGLLHKYDGMDACYGCSKWIQDIDDNTEIFGWTSAQKLVNRKGGTVIEI